ncbi:MAG: glycosyltransferase family 4 protein [Candidatus Electryonea clarkiae]|nr:glycosyltransferase family 4 protein [Candidatus Electryonea clarkiae]MDP8286572.1 glycosyltransferase family 4 protein [Candidatus Electryonea clarkiae]
MQNTNNKLLVCHLTSAHRALDTRIFNREAISLLKAGYNVSIIGSHHTNEFVSGVKIISLKPPAGIFSRLFVAFKILQLSLRENAAIYHFHDPELIPAGLFLKIFGKRVIYDVHEDYEQNFLTRKRIKPPFDQLIARMFTHIERFASMFFDFIVVVDSNIKSKFSPDKTRLITNVPPRNFTDTSRTRQTNESFRLLFLGIISYSHGITQMLDAIQLMKNKKYIELHLIGTLEMPEMVKLWENNPQVIHHGRVPWEKTRQMLTNADLGLFLYQPNPTHWYFTGEGNTKLFEYMGSGLPLLYSNFPKLKKLIDPIGCGQSVDPTNPEKIAQAIDLLYEEQEVRLDMGEKGKQAVLKRFNWEVEEQKLFEIYSKVLDR